MTAHDVPPADLSFRPRPAPLADIGMRRLLTFLLLYPFIDIGLAAWISLVKWGISPPAIFHGTGAFCLVVAAACAWRRDRRWLWVPALVAVVFNGLTSGLPAFSLIVAAVLAAIMYFRQSPAKAPAP